MSKGAFNVIEVHFEKIMLGLAGVFLLVMLWMYILQSPNKIPFEGQPTGPGELYEKVSTMAKQLDTRITSATADGAPVEKFSQKLEQSHSQGIFASAELPRELTRVASFGGDVEVPGLESAEEAPGSIQLVTPLPPKKPVVTTGRSLVLERQVEISNEPPKPESAADEKPVELAWVTVAAYFDKQAQFQEMVNAKYAAYRQKVYIAGADVERQEMLSTGAWSDWQPVQPRKAMPKIDIHDPVIDSRTGQLVPGAKQEIDQMFKLVKYEQNRLMQPPFYYVEAGAEWDTPPLEGYEVEEDADDLTKSVAKAEEPAPSTPPTGRAPTGRSGGGRFGGGRFGGGGESGGGRFGGRGSIAAPQGASPAEQRRLARTALREEFKEIAQHIKAKEWAAARDMAQQITTSEFATLGDKNKAKNYIKKAEREMAREARAEQRDAMATGAESELVTHPETKMPALWFHDDTVETGKTYRYRIRVKLWNRYVGQMRALAKPEMARKSILEGEWSFPSDPITVTPVTHFFVTGGNANNNTAGVDVWRWRQGVWLRERFEVGVGDVIGGVVQNVKTGDLDDQGREVRESVDFTTNAIVLDIRQDETVQNRLPGKENSFTYTEKKSMVVTYLDPADGQVKERVQIFDRVDPIKKTLEENS